MNQRYIPQTQSQKSGKLSPEIIAIAAAAAALAIALGILWILSYLTLPANAVIVGIILLLPVFVYLVLSGKLRELSGPGGWLAKFTQTTQERVSDFEWMTPVPIQVDLVYREPTKMELRQNPNMLEVTLDGAGELSPLCDYLGFLEMTPAGETVRYVVFVEGEQQFQAFLPLTSITRHPAFYTPDEECNSKELVEWMCHRDKFMFKLKQLNGFVVRENAARTDWSKKECLREMFKRSVDALPVINDQGKLVGIAEKTRLVTSILVDVTAMLED